MRILAIRGCNLASLAGEFEIDLARAPFSDAGVFAIVGNTGAGKSTLLDALCVALFDRTPRLTNHSRVVVGRGEDDPSALGAQDARTLLRRGAASGWAEVDFESGDARRYRARWSVRRARGQTDGTLQDQQLTLRALDGDERLGGTKTETLKAIAARLGLSFDQFRRSALLAQGEFAAFLRADGRDRSELLERMTGTEIYTRLSIAAHARAAVIEQQVRDLRAGALAIDVLDDDARAALEAELGAAATERHALRAELAVAEACQRWSAERAAREGAVAAAQRVCDEAEHLATAAATTRRELALRRGVEGLRATWDELGRLARAVDAAESEAATLALAERELRAVHERASAERAAIAATHAPIRAARIAAGLTERPAVSQGDAGEPELAAAWLAAHVRLAPVVGTWPALDVRFGEHATECGAIAELDRTLDALEGRRIAQETQRGAIETEHRGAAARLEAATARAQKFHGARGLTLDAARRGEEQARAHLVEVERLVAIASGARQARTAQVAIDGQLEDVARSKALDLAHLAELETERIATTAVRGERERVLGELRRAAGYSHARTELVDGEPCPLCGGLEHPWRDRGALDEAVAASARALGEVTSQLEAIGAAVAAIAARDQQRVREVTRLASHRQTAMATAESAVVAWREHLAALGELMLEHDPGTPAAERMAAEREASARQRLEAARDARRHAEAATKAAAEAHADVELTRSVTEQLGGQLAEIERVLAEGTAVTARLRGERGIRLARRDELAAALGTAASVWTGRVADPGDLEATRSAIGELAATWRARAEAVVEGEARLAGALAAADAEVAEYARRAAEQAARQQVAVARHHELIGARADVEARFERARAAIACAAALSRDELGRYLADAPVAIEALAAELALVDQRLDAARAAVRMRAELLAEHLASAPVIRPDAAEVGVLAARVEEIERGIARLETALAADRAARERRAAAEAALATAEERGRADLVLADVIGSHDGKLFRSYAQSLTLDALLAVANAHLDELAPRYQLERVPRHDLELQVIDRDLGDEVRSVQSLSGGETFLVSLALALGLSSMSAHDVRVRTLLIDEGFGTLDPATLDGALSVLDALQATGRQVGVISHVPALVERVGAHVRVIQRGGGRSEVVVS